MLQQMIDSCTAGSVVLPSGTYVLNDSLRLRSGVTIRGEGKVVLRRAPVRETPLTQIAGYGHCELCVADTSAFPPGTGVAVTDERSCYGFSVTVARVVHRDAGRLFIDRPVERDFGPNRRACVRTIFPIVAGEGVRHARLEGVTIEGDASPRPFDGCRDAGIYLIGCRDVKLSRVEVARYPSDAVSFQQCVDVVVERCHLHHNDGHGLHPGSGSVRYVMRFNRVSFNGGCGVFYCLRTTHSHCIDNHFEANGAAGVSVGERDTHHLIAGNTIVDNQREGILFRAPVATGGDRVLVTRNTIQNNGVAAAVPQVSVAAKTNDVVIEANTFASSLDGTPLIRIGEDCRGIRVADNRLADKPLPGTDIIANSPMDAAVDWIDTVGPAALAEDGARHLGVATLEPWQEPATLSREGI